MKKMIQQPLRSILSLAILGLAANQASAGGFSLYTESSAVSLGNFAAGAAAEAADASTGWYNPAGLALIRSEQAVGGGVGVFPDIKLAGTSVYTGPGTYTQNFSNIHIEKNAFIPFFHYAKPIGDRATFGFSTVAPFGLSTENVPTSPMRYSATFTEIITINGSPEIGFKVNDHFALGAALDIQYSQVKFNRMLGFPTVAGAAVGNPFALDSLSYNKGHSVGIGGHAGVMAMFNEDHTRVGFNYQSRMHHQFRGYSQLTGPLAAQVGAFGINFNNPATWAVNPAATFRNNGLISNEIYLPDVLTLSGYHDVNEKIAVLGSVVYTGWSTFKDIQLNGVAAVGSVPTPPAPAGTLTRVAVNSASSQNYRDTWRAALGVNYRLNEQLMFRLGGGYDQTPTNNVDRDVRLPDSDRWAASIGAHYQMRPSIGIDFGYTHLFADGDGAVNKIDPLGATSSYRINATAKSSADLVGIQAVWTIDAPTPMVVSNK